MQTHFNLDQHFLSQNNLHFLMIWAVIDDIVLLVLAEQCDTVRPVCVFISLQLETQIIDAVFMDSCLSLCSRVKELKRAREHETPQKSPLAMWHHSPDSSFLFCLYPRHFTIEMEKKNINASTAIITTTAVLLVQLLLHVQQHFFTYLFFPLTWFWSESGNSYRIIN